MPPHVVAKLNPLDIESTLVKQWAFGRWRGRPAPSRWAEQIAPQSLPSLKEWVRDLPGLEAAVI